MIKYLQLPFLFDTTLMQDELKKIAEEQWLLHYQTMHYEGEWTAIPLRSADGSLDNVFINPAENPEYKDTSLLHSSPLFREILLQFKCPLLAVRLLKLNAGATIKEHKDADLQFEKGEARIHIPIITHPLVEFYLDKERINMQEGECWYMNFNLPHSIINNSPVNRVHLVIDVVANEWITTLFSQPLQNKREVEEQQYDAETKQAIIAQLRSMNTETADKLADQMEDV